MIHTLRKAAVALALLGSAFVANPASALIFNPASDGPSGVTVTAGFIDSWYIPAKKRNPDAPPPTLDNEDFPANQNASTIEALVQKLVDPSVTPSIDVVLAGQVDSIPDEQEKSSSTTIAGTLFAIHLGAGELVYRYASLITLFEITLPEEGRGLGLSNFRVFTEKCLQNCGGGGGDPNPVPVPGALGLLLSGLAGFGFLATRRKKTIAA